jgi:hypothetical protein
MRRRGRWTALGLFALAALPVCAAFVAYFLWTPASGTNYGELIPPRQLPDASITAPDGTRFALSSLRGRWVLVQVDGGGCGGDCAAKLFLMRQMRLAQGKDMGRIERLWLLDDEAAPDARLLEAHAGLRVGRAMADFLQLFPAQSDPREHLYLIDPLGHLMLRFPRDADARAAFRDLGRLLKVSHVG